MIVAGERRQFRGGRMHGGPPPEVGHKILRAEFRQFAKAGDRAAGVALEAEMAGSETRPAREEIVSAQGQFALRQNRRQRRHPVQLPILRSEEHTSELQSLMRISYAVFCLKKTKKHTTQITYK